MKIGVSTHIHVYNPLDGQLLAKIKNAGFETVELYSNLPHWPEYGNRKSQESIAGHCLDLGLDINSLHTPFFRTLDHARSGKWLSISAKDKDVRSESVGRIIDSLTLAEFAPVAAAVVHTGGPGEPEDGSTFDRIFYSLEEILPVSRELGVTIALENITNDFSRGYRIAAFIRESRLEGVGCCYDCGHATLYGRTLEELEEMSELLVTTHIHDTSDGLDNHLLPFEGDIEWDALSGKFAEIGYKGDLIIESKDDTGSVQTLKAAYVAALRLRDKIAETPGNAANE